MNLTRHLVVLVALSICTVFIGGLYSTIPVTEQRLPQGIQFGTSQESYFIASKGESNTREERKKFIAGVRAALRIDPIPAEIIEEDEIITGEEVEVPVSDPIVTRVEKIETNEGTPSTVIPEIISTVEQASIPTETTTIAIPTEISPEVVQPIS